MVHTKCSVILDLTCVTGTDLVYGEDNCKYLGILECDMIILKEVKEAVHKEYLAILQEILKISMSYKKHHVHRCIRHYSTMVWVWCHTLDTGGIRGT